MRDIQSRILNNCIPEPNSGCWLWLGELSFGYGRMMYRRERCQAHIFSYRTFKCDIPDGLSLDHLCRNRSCVNPDHLEPVTCQENILRGEGLAAQNAKKTHCKRGHEFTPENIIVTGHGSRSCRECKREWERNHPRVSHNDRRLRK